MGKMKIIGITGGAGTGKSTVAAILEKKGAVVLDADAITKELQKKGAPAYVEIKEWLGEEYILTDGELDRKKIGELIFNDPNAKARINRIVHGKVGEEIKRRIAELEENPPEGKTMIVLDVPIPVERGFLDTAEVIWVVAANSDIRAERLMKRMGISYDAAMDIIDSQLSNSEYEALADFVIINEKGRRELRKQIGEALERI